MSYRGNPQQPNQQSSWGAPPPPAANYGGNYGQPEPPRGGAPYGKRPFEYEQPTEHGYGNSRQDFGNPGGYSRGGPSGGYERQDYASGGYRAPEPAPRYNDNRGPAPTGYGQAPPPSNYDRRPPPADNYGRYPAADDGNKRIRGGADDYNRGGRRDDFGGRSGNRDLVDYEQVDSYGSSRGGGNRSDRSEPYGAGSYNRRDERSSSYGREERARDDYPARSGPGSHHDRAAPAYEARNDYPVRSGSGGRYDDSRGGSGAGYPPKTGGYESRDRYGGDKPSYGGREDRGRDDRRNDDRSGYGGGRRDDRDNSRGGYGVDSRRDQGGDRGHSGHKSGGGDNWARPAPPMGNVNFEEGKPAVWGPDNSAGGSGGWNIDVPVKEESADSKWGSAQESSISSIEKKPIEPAPRDDKVSSWNNSAQSGASAATWDTPADSGASAATWGASSEPAATGGWDLSDKPAKEAEPTVEPKESDEPNPIEEQPTEEKLTEESVEAEIPVEESDESKPTEEKSIVEVADSETTVVTNSEENVESEHSSAKEEPVVADEEEESEKKVHESGWNIVDIPADPVAADGGWPQ